MEPEIKNTEEPLKNDDSKTKEDPLKEIKKMFSSQTKTYPKTEWWDWDSD